MMGINRPCTESFDARIPGAHEGRVLPAHRRRRWPGRQCDGGRERGTSQTERANARFASPRISDHAVQRGNPANPSVGRAAEPAEESERRVHAIVVVLDGDVDALRAIRASAVRIQAVPGVDKVEIGVGRKAAHELSSRHADRHPDKAQTHRHDAVAERNVDRAGARESRGAIRGVVQAERRIADREGLAEHLRLDGDLRSTLHVAVLLIWIRIEWCARIATLPIRWTGRAGRGLKRPVVIPRREVRQRDTPQGHPRLIQLRQLCELRRIDTKRRQRLGW